jgi:predicted phage terminase large subunit-like protein
MSALQFVGVPGYSALLLRRSFSDLKQPGALIPRAMAWLGGTSARWTGQDHLWTFPSGATLKFGYLETTQDKYQYQSAEFQFIGFDELTQFRESDYRYMFSRLRRPDGMNVPLRVRSATNPGNVGHEWVKRRFLIEGAKNGRYFVPATIDDNPHIDRKAYIESLSNLDPVTRSQLLRGDWTARATGGYFQREKFAIVDEYPAKATVFCRFWDLASTPFNPAIDSPADEPCWTAGVLMTFYEGIWYVVDVARIQGSPKAVKDLIQQTAALDPPGTRHRMEEEGGASGPTVIDDYARNVLAGFDFRGVRPVGSKITRLGPYSSAVESGNVRLVRGKWNTQYLDNMEAVPNGPMDMADASSGAMREISHGHSIPLPPKRESTIRAVQINRQRATRKLAG